MVVSDALKKQLLKYCDTLVIWAKGIPSEPERNEIEALSIELVGRINTIASCEDRLMQKQQLRDLRFALLAVNPKCYTLREKYEEVPRIGNLESANILAVCSIDKELLPA